MNAPPKFHGNQLDAPVRFDRAVERLDVDEAATTQGLVEIMRYIAETTFAHGGHPIRPVHAKSHGILEGYLEVDAGLPADLAQGLFAKSGRYPLVMRFSTIPGDILDDSVSVPRGLAIKVIGVEGERLEGSERDVTQDFVFNNGPAFGTPTPKKFRARVRLLALTTDRVEWLKRALSVVMRQLQRIIRRAYRPGQFNCRHPRGTSPNSHPGRHFLQSGRVALWRLHRENCGGADIPGAGRAQASALGNERQAVWPPGGGGRVFQKERRHVGGQGPIVHRPRPDAD